MNIQRLFWHSMVTKTKPNSKCSFITSVFKTWFSAAFWMFLQLSIVWFWVWFGCCCFVVVVVLCFFLLGGLFVCSFLILSFTLSLLALWKNEKLLPHYRLSNIYLGASNLRNCTTYVMVSTLQHKGIFCVDFNVQK